MRAARLTAAICAALVVCSVTGLGASARADAANPKLGVISVKSPTDAQLARMGRAGLDVYRLNLYWPAIQPFGADSFHWNEAWLQPFDDQVCKAAKNGIRILPTVFGSPRWANGNKSPETPPLPAYLDEFSAFMAAAAARYGNGGTIWSDANGPCAGVTPMPITVWQIWNEPNLNYFWSPGPNAAAYAKLLAAANDGLASSGAQVMMAGLSPRPRPAFGTRPIPYLSALYANGVKPHFDVMAVHPYDLNPSNAFDQIDDLRAKMKTSGDGDKPLWITEIGWASAGPKTGLTVKPAVQARYLETMWKTARNSPGRRIKGMIWFSFRDVPYFEVTPPAPADGWTYHSGLFTSSGAPKPAWFTLARLAGGNPY